MNGRSGQLSLFLTLGIAAIDMLSCAFVSSVLLFIMFLQPQPASGGGTAGSESALIFHWSFTSPSGTVLAITLQAPGQRPQTIWSDIPDTGDKACFWLSKAPADARACSLVLPADPAAHDGMLIIQQPRSGAWNAKFTYADTKSHGNVRADDVAVDVRLTVIGKDVLSIAVKGFGPGNQINIRDKAPAKSVALDVE